MRLPIIVASENGHFVARPAYALEPKVTGPTHDAAVLALGNLLGQSINNGSLTFIDLNIPKDAEENQPYAVDSIEVGAQSIMDYAGVFKGDAELEEICKEAYRRRAELRKQEWGE